jgi:hypothetical protein
LRLLQGHLEAGGRRRESKSGIDTDIGNDNTRRDYSQNDSFQIRRHFPWLILFLFSLEGAAGIAPAVFTDTVNAGNGKTKCDFLWSSHLSWQSLIDAEIVLSVVTPCILPFAVRRSRILLFKSI